MNIDKLYGNMTEEQIAKAKQCKSPEEFLKLVDEEEFELTEEQMDSISGGTWW